MWTVAVFRPCLNILHSRFLSGLTVCVCVHVSAFSDLAYDESESRQWKWPSSRYLSPSFLPSVSLYACVCSSSNDAPVMGSEPSQWKWQVEDTVFASPFCCSVFHAVIDLSLVHRITHQGTSTDQVKNLNEALSSFFCVSADEVDRENHSESLWDPNNSHEVELQHAEGQELVGWVHTGKDPIRKELHVCQLGSLLAVHCDFWCHVQLSACKGKCV